VSTYIHAMQLGEYWTRMEYIQIFLEEGGGEGEVTRSIITSHNLSLPQGNALVYSRQLIYIICEQQARKQRCVTVTPTASVTVVTVVIIIIIIINIVSLTCKYKCRYAMLCIVSMCSNVSLRRR